MEVGVAGLTGTQAAAHAHWPLVPYWNEVVDEKRVKLAGPHRKSRDSLLHRQKGPFSSLHCNGSHPPPVALIFWKGHIRGCRRSSALTSQSCWRAGGEERHPKKATWKNYLASSTSRP
ncbi:unnamed protein product [Pleuronectes platessa]|uniref:Uncharacterized protein n=1 Tax=Pleuronectes platessa TaxID=8262 RepID=A0A9N7U4V1_PLEPL|nr:unnamed protein product [Pleuronectes platessa]